MTEPSLEPNISPAPTPTASTVSRRYPHWQYRFLLPASLFLATCASTFWVAATDWLPFGDSLEATLARVQIHWPQGLTYMVAVMAILMAHELGHFLMTVRYRIPATLPLFLPMPLVLTGTMGAVIGMAGAKADRRQLFDTGIAGPLAGLVVLAPVLWIGLMKFEPPVMPASWDRIPAPLMLQMMAQHVRPDLPELTALHISRLNPWMMASFVGLLVTGLNMVAVGQLDGGHTAYALLGRRAHWLARALLIAAILYILAIDDYRMGLMIILVALMGTDHPPSADDTVRLGWVRRAIGWTSLSIPIFCLPPFGLY